MINHRFFPEHILAGVRLAQFVGSHRGKIGISVSF